MKLKMTNRNKKLITLAKEIIRTISPLKEIKAMGIYGAVALGFEDKFSDIDLVALYDKSPSIKKREILLKKLQGIKFIDDLPDKKAMDYFNYKNKEVTISYKNIKKFEKIIKNFNKGKFIWQEVREVIGRIHLGKIIYDPKDKFKNLKNQIKKPKISKKLWPLDHLNRTCYGNRGPWGDRLKTAIERKNEIAIHNEFNELITSFIISLYTLNGLYYTTPKWIFKHLKQMKLKPKNTEKRLRKLAILGNTFKNIKKKRKILKLLTNDLNKLLK